MAIQDDAKNFLLSALARAGGDLPSLQLEWLATQGYTRGTIDDRWQAYLAANAYYLPEGLSRLLVGLNRAIGNNWTPNLLFQSGDILLWYDPSDLTTMFKDTAGTQPVTADGDSVALMLDKGGLSDGRGIVNRLLYSGDLTNAVWTKTNLVTPTVDSNGWIRMQASASAATTVHSVTSAPVTGSYVYRLRVKKGSGATDANQFLFRNNSTGVNVSGISLNYDTGEFSYVFGSSGFTVEAGDAAGEWIVTCVVTGAVTAGNSIRCYVCYTGAIETSGEYAFVKEIQLEVGTVATAYQANGATVGGPGYHRIQATGTSMPKYKTDGTLHWLLYDGTDDGHATGTITWGTDEVAICVGVTKSSDAASGVLAEYGNFDTTNGCWYLLAPGSSGVNSYRFGSRGNGSTADGTLNVASTFSAPHTAVLTCLSDISADSNKIRVNGTQDAERSAELGSGNFSNSILYFGRRGGVSAPLNGREYQTVIRSRLLSAAELSKLETFVAEKTGVIL